MTALVLAAVLALLVSACGRSVTVQIPETAQDSASCGNLKDKLPDSLSGERRLSVDPNSAFTAAWGAPAIVWRCDVPPPSALGPASQILSVDGRDWFPEELERGVRFTSVNDAPRQELTVPADYPDPASLLTRVPD